MILVGQGGWATCSEWCMTQVHEDPWDSVPHSNLGESQRMTQIQWHLYHSQCCAPINAISRVFQEGEIIFLKEQEWLPNFVGVYPPSSDMFFQFICGVYVNICILLEHVSLAVGTLSRDLILVGARGYISCKVIFLCQ